MNIDLKQKILELIMLDIRYFGKSSKGEYVRQTVLSKEVSTFLKEYPVGGIILFCENIENNEQGKRLVEQLQAKTVSQKFIAIDEEGGIVSRVGIETVGNMALGAINNVEDTRITACGIAHKLAGLGINFNFAPVVDINSNPNNPVIGVRSFGSASKSVTRHARAFITGLHEFNIISCVKHFPGHGDTNSDSHLGLTNLNKTLEELNNCELVPYKMLIKENLLDAVMTAHITIPEFNVENNIAPPATLSGEILTNLLRKKMGFNGVIVTDAMDMKAITENFEPVVATIESLRAGCDIILMPVRIWDETGIHDFKKYFAKIVEACSIDKVLRERVDESYIRIIKLKSKFLQTIRPAVVSFPEEAFLAYQNTLAQKSATLYKNEQQHIPFKLSATSNLLLVADKNDLLESALIQIMGISKQEKAKKYFRKIKCICLDYSNINKKLLNIELNDISHVIVLTYNLNEQDKDINKLFITLNKSKLRYVMISCRNPYDIKYATKANTNLLVYGVTGFDQTNCIVNKFLLNFRNTLEKLFTARSAAQFMHFCPVMDA